MGNPQNPAGRRSSETDRDDRKMVRGSFGLIGTGTRCKFGTNKATPSPVDQ